MGVNSTTTPMVFGLPSMSLELLNLESKELLDFSDKMLHHKIPCDAVWLDIEMTDQKKYFTWDQKRFRKPRARLEQIKANGQRLVTINDSYQCLR